ncbi:hypothetical protein BaRGS_00014363 [Batillaria attramentaria]|uniref:Uncharacterized protein n=1 Tax=Batillaria attramentaria TaxID=370345 RepID=A0ABD0L4M0_9CAEN
MANRNQWQHSYCKRSLPYTEPLDRTYSDFAESVTDDRTWPTGTSGSIHTVNAVCHTRNHLTGPILISQKVLQMTGHGQQEPVAAFIL